jgi:denticleless
VVSGSTDASVYIWQASAPADPPYILPGHGGEVTGVDWSASDHTRLASCADDGSMRVWSLQRRDVPQTRRTTRRMEAAEGSAAPEQPAVMELPPAAGAVSPVVPPTPAVGEEPGGAAQEGEITPVPGGFAALMSPLPVAPAAPASRGATLFVRTMTSFFPPSAETAAPEVGRIRIALKGKRKANAVKAAPAVATPAPAAS